MYIRHDDKRFRVENTCMRGKFEVWNVYTIRGRHLGTFKHDGDDSPKGMESWKAEIFRIIEADSLKG